MAGPSALPTGVATALATCEPPNESEFFLTTGNRGSLDIPLGAGMNEDEIGAGATVASFPVAL